MPFIEIPSSITSIGDATFVDCSSLTTVKLPSSLVSIGNSVFMLCNRLTSIEIPASVTRIGDYAFVESAFEKLYLYAKLSDYRCLNYINGTAEVYAYESETDKIREYWDGALMSLDDHITGIGAPTSAYNTLKVECYYKSDGRKCDVPQKGLNIVRYSDGSTRKVIVK